MDKDQVCPSCNRFHNGAFFGAVPTKDKCFLCKGTKKVSIEVAAKYLRAIRETDSTRIRIKDF